MINADKYGDWCMPPESPELIHSQDPARKTDGALIATAYYYKVSQMLAKFARLQGLEDEAKEFEKDAAKLKTASMPVSLQLRRELLRYKCPMFFIPTAYSMVTIQ